MNMESKMNEKEEEQELDPASERIRQKLVRMLAVSIGTLVVGIAAVLFAVIYKLNGGGKTEAAESPQTAGFEVPAGVTYEGLIDLPDGAEIISSSLNGSHIMLTVMLSEGTSEIWLYDLNTARVFGRISVQ